METMAFFWLPNIDENFQRYDIVDIPNFFTNRNYTPTSVVTCHHS